MVWDDLRVFLAVARAGRVSVAARQLAVEHTTVGRRLAALERDLGVPLFYRTVAGYRLTPHGENVLSSAQSMERAAITLTARAREGAPDARGRVRVAILEEYATYWLAPRLGTFRTQCPNIDLEVLVGSQKLDLLRGEAELAIRTPRPQEPALVVTRLGHARSRLYVAKAVLKRMHLRPKSVLDAITRRELPLVVYTAAYHPLQSAGWFQPILGTANVVLRSNSTFTLLAAARAGAGVTVLPRVVATAHADLVEVSAEDLHVGDFWLVTHPDFRRDPNVRKVAEFLRAHASEVFH